MVVLNPTIVELRSFARDEEGSEFLFRLGAFLVMVESSAIRESLLHRRNLVEEPCSIDEGGANLRMRGTEKV